MEQQTRSGSPAPGRRPTLHDVAEMAGVSIKTVSRVVNDEGGVSAFLSQRVREAIERLDFRPRGGAAGSRRTGGRTTAVGLLLEDVSNPYSCQVQRAVEDVAVPRGVMVISASVDESPEREWKLARAFSERRVEGLIIAPAGDDQSYLTGEMSPGTAIVCFDRAAGHLACDSVLTTNAEGAAEGVRHLIRAGHTRIAFLGDRLRIATARQRLEGYRSALTAAGLPIDHELEILDLCDVTMADGATTTLLTRPNAPTALFTARNQVTTGAVRALYRLGRETQVALVGFDDFPLADLVRPGITVVAQDPAKIGRVAATILFNRLAGVAGPPASHLVPTRLVRRGSGEILAPTGTAGRFC